MPLFTSAKEKRLWVYALIVLITIFSTLIIGRPLLELLSNQDIQAVFFVLGMVLIGTTILAYGIRTKPSKAEIAVWLGFAGVYLMVFLRLGLPERSHLMEYSVLAIFIHMALMERVGHRKKVLIMGILAFLITVLLGLIDKAIQLFLPGRVFDPLDIVFNSFVAFMAIASSMVLQWLRKKIKKYN